MKVIETKYNGFLFRSRLEARWAVYFDSLGIKWFYEYEGFQFSDGTRYLPDFYLPDFKFYVEIKPTEPTAEEYEKLDRFCFEGCGAIALFVGLPGDAPGSLYCFHDGEFINEYSCFPWCSFIHRIDENTTYFCISTDEKITKAYTNENNDVELENISRNTSCPPEVWHKYAFGTTRNAINAAKSARFEDGRIHEYSRQNAEPVQGW